jgi:hypothetical protein
MLIDMVLLNRFMCKRVFVSQLNHDHGPYNSAIEQPQKVPGFAIACPYARRPEPRQTYGMIAFAHHSQAHTSALGHRDAVEEAEGARV